MEFEKYDSILAIRLDDGEELVTSIKEACQKAGVKAGLISGIGAIHNMNVRIASRGTEEFVFKTISGPMEITSLAGNISELAGDLFVHLHITAADTQMQIWGGHVINCIVAATGEVFVQKISGQLSRETSSSGPLQVLQFR